MEAPTNYLRESDVYRDFTKPGDDWRVMREFCGSLIKGSPVCYIVATGILKGAELACFNACQPYSFVAHVHTFIYVGLVGSAGTLVYRIQKSFENTHLFLELIKKDSNNIVPKSKYEKLVEVYGPKISPDLDKRFCIPTDIEMISILERESAILSDMMQEIIEEKSDPIAVYKGVLEYKEINETSVYKFLKSTLSNDNVCEIYRFAKANDLAKLMNLCKAYYKINMTEIGLENSFKKS